MSNSVEQKKKYDLILYKDNFYKTFVRGKYSMFQLL